MSKATVILAALLLGTLLRLWLAQRHAHTLFHLTEHGQRLQQADFQSLSASEFNLVEKLARRVKLPLPRIQGRRTRAGGRGERMHWAKTMQQAARQDGDVLRLPRMQRKPQAPRT